MQNFGRMRRENELSPLSSLRTQGPIPRDLSVRRTVADIVIHYRGCGVWVPAFAGTTRRGDGAHPHSAAFAVFPNIRVGAAKPHEVPSVTLTWSSHGKRYVPATMSCMNVYGQSIAPPFTAT